MKTGWECYVTHNPLLDNYVSTYETEEGNEIVGGESKDVLFSLLLLSRRLGKRKIKRSVMDLLKKVRIYKIEEIPA